MNSTRRIAHSWSRTGIVALRSCAATRNLASAAYTDPLRCDDPAVNTTPSNLTPHQREILGSALRVDQAGEIAANWIYRGQHLVLGRDPSTGPLIQVIFSRKPRLSSVLICSPGHVGSREKTPIGHGQTSGPTSGPTNLIV